jgi:hypothetical protein
MVDLRDYIGNGARVGDRQGAWLKVLVGVQVGTGEFTALEPQRLAFKGRVELPFFKGDLSLALHLQEGGVVDVAVNGRKTRGTWAQEGARLRVEARAGDKHQVLLLGRGGKGGAETHLSLSGALGATVHVAALGPAPAAV